MTSQPYAHIYLSPHLDDVVYSCGGRIYEQVCAGARVVVASFFTGSPARYDLTPFTRELQERWGGAADSVAVRRQEDLDALQVLGAAGLHLGLLDCVYRCSPQGEAYYPTVEHIFAEIHPAEAAWHHELLAMLRAAIGGDMAGATLYAPLAAGHHVDHILVQRAAFLLCAAQGQADRALSVVEDAVELPASSPRLIFYEDYPYAGDEGVVGAALQASARPGCPWQRETAPFGEAALLAKGRAMAAYVSQVSTFWPDIQVMFDTIRRQALVVGQGRYGENYWRVTK